MAHNVGDVAKLIEVLEAQASVVCVASATSGADCPLKAVVNRTGSALLCTPAAFNSGVSDRVIAFDAQTPASEDDHVAIESFGSTRSHLRFVVEATPASQREFLAEELNRHGTEAMSECEAQCWNSRRDFEHEAHVIEVRESSVITREQWSAIKSAICGLRSFFASWFGDTIGQEGIRPLGVFGGDVPVSTGVICVDGDAARNGFSATPPFRRSRSHRVAARIRRLHVVAEMGCSIVPTETAGRSLKRLYRSLHNQMSTGSLYVYN